MGMVNDSSLVFIMFFNKCKNIFMIVWVVWNDLFLYMFRIFLKIRIVYDYFFDKICFCFFFDSVVYIVEID